MPLSITALWPCHLCYDENDNDDGDDNDVASTIINCSYQPFEIQQRVNTTLSCKWPFIMLFTMMTFLTDHLPDPYLVRVIRVISISFFKMTFSNAKYDDDDLSNWSLANPCLDDKDGD